MGNLINDEDKSSKNIIPKKIDPSLLIPHDSDIKSYKIYTVSKLKPHQRIKINDIIEFFHKNGTPRKSDDFSVNNYLKFYPKEDHFFYNKDITLIHNNIKIYNENESDMNKIQIYKGDLNIKGERHGLGKLITQYYELIGTWKNDKLNGWGRQSRCNGEVLEGRFENGLLNGKGIYLDSNNYKYLGDFRDMKKWGKGKLITDKIIYEGDFCNDKFEGKGKIKFLKNGDEYEGSFVNGNIEGVGVFKYLNGDIYKGEFKNGKMHGNGIYKYRIGKIYRGLFENGKIKMIKNVKIDNISDKKNYENFEQFKPFKKNKDLNIYGNNQFNLSNVSKIDKFGQDKINNTKYNYSTNILQNDSINKNKIKENEENPELLMSTYRNFGFGEQYNNNDIY